MKYVCPMCKKKVDDTEPFIPFCSKRCKMQDLGAWLSEDYKIKGKGRNVNEAPENIEDYYED